MTERAFTKISEGLKEALEMVKAMKDGDFRKVGPSPGFIMRMQAGEDIAFEQWRRSRPAGPKS